MNMQM